MTKKEEMARRIAAQAVLPSMWGPFPSQRALCVLCPVCKVGRGTKCFNYKGKGKAPCPSRVQAAVRSVRGDEPPPQICDPPSGTFRALVQREWWDWGPQGRELKGGEL